MRPPLILISRFNTNNIGDIVIANTLKNELNLFGKVYCISLFGRPRVQKDINKIINYKVNKEKLHFFERLIRKVEKKMVINRGIKNNSIIFLGGGNAMVDVKETTMSVTRFVPYINASKKRNCSLVALDIGIGPFVNTRQQEAAIEILNQMNFISFRDECSKKLYEDSNGVVPHILSVDPAFFFMERKDSKKMSSRRKIGINLLNQSLILDNESFVVQVLEGYRKLGVELVNSLNADVFYYITDEADMPFLQNIENYIHDENLYVRYIEGVKDLFEFYDELDVVIGTRMHSIILAYSRHVPVIGLNWQNKIYDLFSLLESQDKLFSFDNLISDSNSIVLAVLEIYKNYELEQKKITRVYEKLKNRHYNCRLKITQLIQEDKI